MPRRVSIGRLFIAGAIPGILLMVLFMGYTAIWAKLNPAKSPEIRTDYTLKEKFSALSRLIPIVLLICFVLGSIYAGLTTPTEAASFGVLGALILAATSGSLSWQSFSESLMGAVKTSCMITFILASAAFLTVAMGFIGLPASSRNKLRPCILPLICSSFFSRYCLSS
ncbi:TRAP transporter large permease subunit [Vibrio sp. PP-XX7]